MRVGEMLRAAAPTLSVGVVSADLLSLGTEIALLEEAGVQVAHFDVMDGVFCPMMTVGPPLVRAVRTPMLKDVHLMIDDPVDKVDAFVAAGADIVTVHAESTAHVHRVLQKLATMENRNDPARGIARGVALNPGTPIGVLEPLLADLDLIVLLAVNPGWGGQSFHPGTAKRAEQARALIGSAGRDIALCIDGGVTAGNLGDVAAMGPDLIVTGSAVFDGGDVAGNARRMLDVLAGSN